MPGPENPQHVIVSGERPCAEGVLPDQKQKAGFWQSSRATTFAVTAILITTIAAYSSSFSGVFVFDDFDAISRNPTIRHLWNSWNPPSEDTAVLSRPVVNFSLAVNYAISGEKVWSYHALNLVAHLVAALLLFSILHSTFSLPGICKKLNGVVTPLAFVIALFWSVHPLLTNAVTYIVQRTEVLSGMFYLLTVYCAIRSHDSIRRKFWHLGAWSAYLLAMGCKESAISAPLILLFYDRVFFYPSWRDTIRQRRWFYFGFVVLWLLMFLNHFMAKDGKVILCAKSSETVEYALAQCGSILLYLRLSFFPHPLILDYGKVIWQPAGPVVFQFVLLSFIIACLIVAWRRWPWVSFLGLWFFAILAPSSSIIPITSEVAAEKRMYLPLAAVITLAVVAAYALAKWASLRFPASQKKLLVSGWCAVACVGAALAATAYHRNTQYRSEVGLWQESLERRPYNRRARKNTAYCYTNLSGELGQRGRFDEAIECCRRAIRVYPNLSDAYLNLGSALMGCHRDEEALAALEKALELDPKSASVHVNLGIAHAHRGALAQAVEQYQKAIELEPKSVEAYEQLGFLRQSEGKLNEAMACFEKILTLQPNHPTANNQLGWMYARCGRLREAEGFFRKALAFAPRNVDARVNLGMALAAMHRPEEAVEQFQKALQIQPNHWLACSHLAWILATSPEASLRDGQKAVELAEHASELTHRENPNVQDTLAAAYAEAGRYGEAVRTEREAVVLANQQKNSNFASVAQTRVKQFELGKPYREMPSSPLPVQTTVQTNGH